MNEKWFIKPCKEDWVIAFGLYLLNLFDAFCTAKFITEGRAVEANPIMAYLISIDMKLFLFVKLVPTFFFVVALLFLNIPRKVNPFLFFLFGSYFVLSLYYFSAR